MQTPMLKTTLVHGKRQANGVGTFQKPPRDCSRRFPIRCGARQLIVSCSSVMRENEGFGQGRAPASAAIRMRQTAVGNNIICHRKLELPTSVAADRQRKRMQNARAVSWWNGVWPLLQNPRHDFTPTIHWDLTDYYAAPLDIALMRNDRV